MIQRVLRFARLVVLVFGGALVGCSSGGGDDNELVLQGVLIQGSGAGAHVGLFTKHAPGEPIGEVSVCALGECSLTDDRGQWGFSSKNVWAGGALMFTLRGHGLDAQAIVELPAEARDVSLEFERGVTEVYVTHLTIDGHTQHLEIEGHEHGSIETN